MKKKLVLFLSLVISIVLFIVLINIQKNIVNQEVLIPIYVVNQNVSKYDTLSLEKLKVLKVTANSINTQECVGENEFQDKVVLREVRSGEILYNNMICDVSKVKNEIETVNSKRIILPISQIDSNLYCLLNDNTYISLYVSINRDLAPTEVNTYMQSKMQNARNTIVTFIYIDKILPIAFLDETGDKQIGKQVKYLLLEVTNEQAIYLNSIKSVADFSIGVL